MTATMPPPFVASFPGGQCPAGDVIARGDLAVFLPRGWPADVKGVRFIWHLDCAEEAAVQTDET